MLGNVTIDKLGRILMDEDPGNDNRIARIWLYSIETRQFIQVAAHNPRGCIPTWECRTPARTAATTTTRDVVRRCSVP